MSVGRPANNFGSIIASAPDRGSFPLDHDGECKEFMKKYLICLKANKNDNGKCRELGKDYLGCRMDKGLMERVAWEDLGFAEPKPK